VEGEESSRRPLNCEDELKRVAIAEEELQNIFTGKPHEYESEPEWISEIARPSNPFKEE
jgi:hypothetical protein